jgi:hypothetical protein
LFYTCGKERGLRLEKEKGKRKETGTEKKRGQRELRK